MIICIEGIPIPLQRHRSFIRAGHVANYDSQIKEKMLFQAKIRNQLCPQEGAITELLSKENYNVVLFFQMPYPQSKIKKNMPALQQIPHIVKPDLDNLIKFVLDCGNGLLWQDDKKINSLVARKIYSETPKTIISID